MRPLQGDDSSESPAALVLMGVAGSGKSTVGAIVARRMGCGFIEADDFHPPENRNRMRAGVPLSDEDRLPWLRAVRNAVGDAMEDDRSVVVACSALRQIHRETLVPDGRTLRFMWLDVNLETLRARLETRGGHFAGPSLLASQLETLEVDEKDPVERIDGNRSPEDVADDIVQRLRAAQL